MISCQSLTLYTSGCSKVISRFHGFSRIIEAIPACERSYAFSIESSIRSVTPCVLQAHDFGWASSWKWFTKAIFERPISGKCAIIQSVVRSTFQTSLSERAVMIDISSPRSMSILTHSFAYGTIGTVAGCMVDFQNSSQIYLESSCVILGSIRAKSYDNMSSTEGIERSFPCWWAYSRSQGKVSARVSSRSSHTCECCLKIPFGSIVLSYIVSSFFLISIRISDTSYPGGSHSSLIFSRGKSQIIPLIPSTICAWALSLHS